jgi:hypothetical protein
MGQEAMTKAAEIKLRAERKAGEALRARSMNPGHRYTGDSPGASPVPTLDQDGITPKQSTQWQDGVAVPEGIKANALHHHQPDR